VGASTNQVRMGTAVVGAGPAGLLFAAYARRRWEQAGRDPADWVLALYDKRAKYSRTHRLRMDPTPYAAMVERADDPRFDAFGAFLEREDHTPNIAELEGELERLAAAFGVVKEVVHVGPEDEQIPLGALRKRVLGDVDAPFTIVGADSVHSTVRGQVQLGRSRAVTHEHLGRLVVRGPGIPRRLSALDTYRISKVVASIFDYRCREEGRAEVDLFLTTEAYAVLVALGATPTKPVELTTDVVGDLGDPLLVRFLRFLGQGFGEGPCSLELHSVFRLQHAIAASRALRPEGLDGAAVFLVGDAAASLPFQRGMACLARSAMALGEAHLAVAEGDEKALPAYDAAVGEIVGDELRVVRARVVLVSGLREFVRISALLPFPIQNWFLSAMHDEPPSGRLSPGLGLNALVAMAMAVVSMGAPLVGLTGPPLTLASVAGIVLGGAGGVVYRATLTFEPVPNAWVRGVWRWTLVFVLMGGVGLAVVFSAQAGGPRLVGLLVLWWLVGIAFAMGVAGFEWIGRRGFAEGRLDGG
jgi:2-polyprenyl-6-methoxyphenol hydroxylase-like FAD-dependent oxidoreductase